MEMAPAEGQPPDLSKNGGLPDPEDEEEILAAEILDASQTAWDVALDAWDIEGLRSLWAADALGFLV